MQIQRIGLQIQRIGLQIGSFLVGMRSLHGNPNPEGIALRFSKLGLALESGYKSRESQCRIGLQIFSRLTRKTRLQLAGRLIGLNFRAEIS